MAATFADAVTGSVPLLTRYARKLAGNRMDADDLIQETVLRALTHAHQFKPDTRLEAWLCAILRNYYLNQFRRRRRLVSSDGVEALPDWLVTNPQEGSLQLAEVSAVIEHLPVRQREALMLVGVNGYSYESAAKIAGCPVGTIKSRVSRARIELENPTRGRFVGG